MDKIALLILLSLLPNKDLTPGDSLVWATPKMICEPGYTSTVRKVPESLKKEVYQEYGISNPKPGEYEIDHLISLQLGGSNDKKNLWPQPATGYMNSHEKDKVERKLNRLICSGQISIKEAQKEIAEDWTKPYCKYIKPCK